MVNKKSFKIISIITTVFVITTLISLKGLITKANVADRPEFEIEFNGIQKEAVVGEDIVVTGKIKPKAFEIPVQQKEIVFVVDSDIKSNYGKLSSLMSNTKNFLDTMASNKDFQNIKIATIEYKEDASIKTSGDTALLDLNKNYNQISNLLKSFSNGSSKTNTGEGLRKALYLLNSQKNNVNTNKTIILVSDSIPTGRTIYDKSSELDGKFYTDISNNDHKNATIDNYIDFEKDLEYAKVIAEIINKKGYNVFTIGYEMTKDSKDAQVLREIHQVMSGNDMSNSNNYEKNGFYLASDNKDVAEKMFSDIANKVIQNYSLNNIKMNINFTGDFSLNITGNTVNLSNVNYQLKSVSNGIARYEASPIDFEFVIKGKKEGYQQIFDKMTITYPWNESSEKVDINESKYITIKSNEAPSISAKFKGDDNIEVENGKILNLSYEIIPDSFTSSILSMPSGKIDEVIFVTNLTKDMKDSERFFMLKNHLVNEIINNPDLSFTKFGFVGYSDSVLVADLNNINDPKNVAMKSVNTTTGLIKPLFNISDGNYKDGFRLLFQNDYVFNSISNNNTRNIDQALNITKEIFEKYGEKDKRKAIVLINSGSVNYSKNDINELKQQGYKIISLDLSGISETNLKNLHVDLGGRISDIKSENDFLVSEFKENKFGDGQVRMKEIAEKLISGVMPNVYSSITSNIYFDLNNNFEYINKSNSINISVSSYEQNKLGFKINNVEYKYSGKMIDGKYEYVAPTQTISFQLKVNTDKTGTLTFAENQNVLDENTYKNYLLYNKFNGNKSKSLIYTPSFKLKEEVKNITHGLYNGINDGQVSIQETNNENPFEIVQGSTVTFGAKFTLSGSTDFKLNVDKNIQGVDENNIKIYQILNGELVNIEDKRISGENNEFNISINVGDNTEVLVVYQGKIIDGTTSGQTLTNDIVFSSTSKKVTIVTPQKTENSPILPDLF